MRNVAKPLVIGLALFLFLSGAVSGGKLPLGKTIFVATQGVVYRVDEDPLTGWPLPIPIWRETERDWTPIDDLIVGPNGYLYLSEPSMHRIVRLNQDGGGETVIVCDHDLRPSKLAFDASGSLLFSTRPENSCVGVPEGIWLIDGAIPGSSPRLIVPSHRFPYLPEDPDGCLISIVDCFPTSSRPDHLLVGPLVEWALGWALGPTFETIAPAISHDSVGLYYDAAILAPGKPAERLLIAECGVGRISEFSMDGEFLRTFADLEKVNSIDTDSDGYVYATRCWEWTRRSGRNSVVVFLPNGTQLTEFFLPGVFGIAVAGGP